MDYRDLLKKYIGRVIDREGVTFIPMKPNDNHKYDCQVFTQEEIDELNKLADESDEPNKEEA